MGWLITLAILVLLAILPLGVSVIYDSQGPLVRIIAGPVKLRVFPAKKKKDKKTKEQKQITEKKPTPDKMPKAETAPKADQPATPAEPKKNGGSFTDFLPLVQVGLDFLGDFRRKLRVNRLEMNVVLAGDDPCDLATNYGKAWAALGNLWPRLEELFEIKKRDVKLQCDFEGSETLITARLDITITLGRILALAVCYGIRAIKELMKIQNKRKGGATS